jgi:hypothetical protein
MNTASSRQGKLMRVEGGVAAMAESRSTRAKGNGAYAEPGGNELPSTANIKVDIDDVTKNIIRESEHGKARGGRSSEMKTIQNSQRLSIKSTNGQLVNTITNPLQNIDYTDHIDENEWERAAAEEEEEEVVTEVEAGPRALLWQVLLGIFVLGSAVWTGLSHHFKNSRSMHHHSSSTVFPVALMEKYCDEVKTKELHTSFATPEALIVLSLLAPAALEALHQVQELAEEMLGDGSSTKTEFKTFEDYQLDRTKKEVVRRAERSKSLGFAVMHLVLALTVLVDYTIHINQAASGSSVMCMASKVLIAPLFKAFAVSMWTVLMSVTNFVHWEVSRSNTPKEVIEQNLIPARERPLNRNVMTDILVFTTAAVLVVWICAALIVSPALVGFFPVVLVLLVVLPMLILVLPLKIMSLLSQKLRSMFASTKPAGTQRVGKEEGTEDGRVEAEGGSGGEGGDSVSKQGGGAEEMTGVEELLRKEPLLLLKIGLMQAFTTMMLLAWFGGVYYSSETWTAASETLASDSLRIIVALPAMLCVSFQWPTFSINFEISFYLFACSIGMLVVEYILKVIAWLDSKLGDSIPGLHTSHDIRKLHLSLRRVAIDCLHRVGETTMVPFRWLTHVIATQTCFSRTGNTSATTTTTNSTNSAHGTLVTPRWRKQSVVAEHNSKVPFDYSSVDNKLVETYAANNPEQHSFDLSDCVRLTDQALWAIALCCTNTPQRAHHLKILSISNCKMITDDGLLPFASMRTKIKEVKMVGVDKLTIVAVTKLLIECEVKPSNFGIPRELMSNVDKALGASDPSTSSGKTRLFIAAEGTANEFTIPFEYKTKDGDVQSLLLLALKNLTNLTIGGLHLDQRHQIKAIDLSFQGWLTEKHFGLLFSVSKLASTVTSLNLSRSNLGVGLRELRKAAPEWKALRELNVSHNKLGPGTNVLANAIKDMDALLKLTFGEKHAVTMTTEIAKADFGGNSLGESGVTVLAAFIPKCT